MRPKPPQRTYRAADPELTAARLAAGAVLYESAGDVAGTAGWAYVHGIATLWRNGNLPPGIGEDPVALTEQLGPYLFQRSKAARREAARDGRRAR
ncbi:MAG TPA: hypothetical protein VNA20_16500 [Frankiaceae bacterium]|nr:hypothetical protein [Frankiaceae bacterium]